jgi:hypothetical protein
MLYSSLSLVFGYRQCFARAVHSSAAAFDLDASDVISGQMQGKGAKTEGDTQSKEKGVGEPQIVRYQESKGSGSRKNSSGIPMIPLPGMLKVEMFVSINRSSLEDRIATVTAGKSGLASISNILLQLFTTACSFSYRCHWN